MAESGQGARSEGWQGTRLRAAIDRLHAAQLAALAAHGEPTALAAPAFAPTALQEVEPVVRRDAYRAQHEALAQVDEIGSLLVRLARLGRADGADGETVAIRRRLVKLAVAAAITLAELVCLAFELEAPAPGDAGAKIRAEENRPVGQPQQPGERPCPRTTIRTSKTRRPS